LANRTNDILSLVESKRRYEVCTVRALFAALEEYYKDAPTEPFVALQQLFEHGLRPVWQPRGYVGYGARIHLSDVKCAMIKAKTAGRIEAPDALVVIDENIPNAKHEVPLHALYIEHVSYLKACQSIGLSNMPWPKDKCSAAWEMQQMIFELESKRDEIKQERTHGYDESSRKRQELQELDAEIKAHWKAFNELNITQGADVSTRSTIKAESQCKRWLVELMHQGPQTKPKSAYRDDARQQWTSLGVNGFNRAWANAIVETQTTQWGKPGRKKSSP
jgi:hypothetical protein